MSIPCVEVSRIMDTENKVSNLKESVTEIKLSMNAMSAQVTELSKIMQTMIMKLDERDKHSLENANFNKQTFERFGSKIDNLDGSIHDIELQIAKSSNLECKVVSLETKIEECLVSSQKTSTLEKVVYGGGSAIIVAMGTVMFWLIQRLVH